MEAAEGTVAAAVSAALARNPSIPALRWKDQWLDWGWLREVADRVNALLDDAGIGPEDTVALVAANRPEHAAAILGLLARARDIVMVYAYQSPDAIARKFAELRCAAFIAGADAWQAPLLRAARDLRSLGIALDFEAQVAVAGTHFDAQAEHRPAEAVHGIALLTSGTTGPPKTSHLPYAVIYRSMVVESPVHPFGQPPPSQTPTLMTSPFGNVAGLYAWLPLVVAGRSAVLHEKFTLERWLDYVREFQPVSTGLPAPGFRMVLDMGLPPEELASVKYMSSGSAPLEVEVQRAFEEKYDVIILPTYGATEFGGGIAVMTPPMREKYGPSKRGSVGQPLPGVEVRVVDSVSGESLPSGQEGVLETRMTRLGPDWIRTTDLAVVDEDGFIFHRGRTDGAIVRGGFKINPNVVRVALLEHPAISDAVVAGIPDRRLGEVPVAAYRLWADAPVPTVAELEAHLRARLPATFLPTRYREVQELPMTMTQKLDMGAVRALFADEEMVR
jgi:acyl-CoA synthetase (AMP-forming)/AMP-acid ligase II